MQLASNQSNSLLENQNAELLILNTHIKVKISTSPSYVSSLLV